MLAPLFASPSLSLAPPDLEPLLNSFPCLNFSTPDLIFSHLIWYSLIWFYILSSDLPPPWSLHPWSYILSYDLIFSHLILYYLICSHNYLYSHILSVYWIDSHNLRFSDIVPHSLIILTNSLIYSLILIHTVLLSLTLHDHASSYSPTLPRYLLWKTLGEKSKILEILREYTKYIEWKRFPPVHVLLESPNESIWRASKVIEW